ncbi:hypothetical protein [Streptomyces sp. NBC_00280]|uniref:hypothetical protein n=1 Tax=Streptomyces sp. NBC_00280 TaxID=2975699 RepID=UPI00324C353D
MSPSAAEDAQVVSKVTTRLIMSSLAARGVGVYDNTKRSRRSRVANRLLAFVVDVERRQWSAHFHARLKDITREGLQARLSRGAADRWEHQTIDYMPFRPADVVRYMLHADRIHRWAPVAPALYHPALVHVHGRTPVERAAVHMDQGQVVRRLQ